MGGASSTTIEIPGGGTDGYHVLRVQPNSPGFRAGLDAFFDFIICINGVRLVRAQHIVAQMPPTPAQNQDDEHFRTTCAGNVDKPVQLVVYSSKDQSLRGSHIRLFYY